MSTAFLKVYLMGPNLQPTKCVVTPQNNEKPITVRKTYLDTKDTFSQNQMILIQLCLNCNFPQGKEIFG